MISALRPSSVLSSKKNIRSFFHILLWFLPCRCTPFTVLLKLLLPFCSVFGKMSFDIQFCQRISFCFLFQRLQAAFYQVFSSGFPGLSLQYPPPHFLSCILLSLLPVAEHSLGCASVLFSPCIRSVLEILGCILYILLCSREVFFRVTLVFHDFRFVKW